MSNKPYSPDGETAELLQLAERQAKRIAELEAENKMLRERLSNSNIKTTNGKENK